MLSNITINNCNLFNKNNYFLNENSKEKVKEIFDNLNDSGNFLVSELNIVINELNELIAKYPNHSLSEKSKSGLLVPLITSLKDIVNTVTKEKIRIGFYATSGSGKSCTINRLVEDKIRKVKDISDPLVSPLPVSTRGGEPTSSCAVILTKQTSNEKRITVKRMTREELLEKAIAAVDYINTKENSENRNNVSIKTIDECRNLLSQWRSGAGNIKNKFKNRRSNLTYLYDFAEKVLLDDSNEFFANETNFNLRQLGDIKRYAEHGDLSCANVKEIVAEVIELHNYPLILDIIDIPGASANKVDQTYFNLIDKSLDAVVFTKLCTGDTFENTETSDYLSRKLSEWSGNTCRYIFIYNAARSLPKGKVNATETGGSIASALEFVQNKLERLFFFDAFDFENNENRYYFDHHNRGDISNIEKFEERLKHLNNYGGLVFLREFFISEWPLLICQEITVSTIKKIDILKSNIKEVRHKLQLLRSMRRPDLLQELLEATNEIQGLKNSVASNFKTLKESIGLLKSKVDKLFNQNTKTNLTQPLQTTGERFIQMISKLCSGFVEVHVYPFLMEGLIKKPIRDLCCNVKSKCRWSIDSQESKPVVELIESKSPLNNEGIQELNNELKRHNNNAESIFVDFYKNAIDGQFFSDLEHKTALNELRDQSELLLKPMLNSIDLDSQSRRAELFDLAKSACVKLCTDLGSCVQVFWFNKIDLILTDLVSLNRNVDRAQ